MTRSEPPKRRRPGIAPAPFTIAAAVAATVLVAPGGGAALPPLDPRQVYHLYFVDVAAARRHETDVVDYIAHRWGTLVHSSTAQNGRIIFLDGGPNGRASTLDLTDTDDDQVTTVGRRLSLELGSSRTAATGIDLAIIADGVRETVDTRFDAIAASDMIQELPAQRLLFIHVITDKLERRRGKQLRPLDEWVFPESCMEDGVVGAALDAFRLRAGATFTGPGVAMPQLKVSFTLVPSDGQRFGEATERSAVQVVLGRSAFDGRALALRDGLACLEVDDRIVPVAAPPGRCQPFRTETPRPARTRDSCVPLNTIDTRERIAELAQGRIEREITPFLKGPAPALPPVRPDDGRASTNRPFTPPTSTGGATSSAEAPKASPAPTPMRPPAAGDAGPSPSAPRPRADAATPPPASDTGPTPAPPASPRGGLPPPPSPGAPAIGTTTPQPPSPAPTATPTTAPAMNVTAPAPSSAPAPVSSSPPGPAGSTPVASPSAPPPAQRLRLTGAAARSSRSSANGNVFPLSGRASITDERLSILLVPVGRTLAETDAHDVVDVTRNVMVRPRSGAHLLVARLKPGLVCDATGRFSFSFGLSGSALEDREASEYDVEVPDACRTGGVDVPFGRVTLK